MVEKYHSVNSQWPEGTREGRDLKPTAQEAVAATRRLYRHFMGKPWPGRFEVTSGNRYSYPRGSVYYVNPDWNWRGGWHEVVHFASHVVARRLYGEGHGPRHAFLEREMIAYVVSRGWHLGALKRPETPKADPATVKLDRTLAAIKRWQTKAKRAATALRKLERARRRYEARV